MKIDLEKFLAATMLLASVTTPACGGSDAKKTDAKAEVKAAPAPAAPAAPAPAPVATPPAAPEAAPPATPPADTAAKTSGGAAAKPDPGPEEEKPSW